MLTHLELDVTVGSATSHPEAPASPTGKIPLLVEPDGTVLYESLVICDYLAERYGFDGYAQDPALRARQRLAMCQFDQVIVKLLYYRDIRLWPFKLRGPRERKALEAELDLLEAVVAETPPRSSLGLHIAPFWLRFCWLSFLIGAEVEIRERPALASWLDAATALPEVQAHAHREVFVRRYQYTKWLAIASLVVAPALALGISFAGFAIAALILQFG